MWDRSLHAPSAVDPLRPNHPWRRWGSDGSCGERDARRDALLRGVDGWEAPTAVARMSRAVGLMTLRIERGGDSGMVVVVPAVGDPATSLLVFSS